MDDLVLHLFREIALCHELADYFFELESDALNLADPVKAAQDQLVHETIDEHVFGLIMAYLEEYVFHEFPYAFFDLDVEFQGFSYLVDFQHDEVE